MTTITPYRRAGRIVPTHCAYRDARSLVSESASHQKQARRMIAAGLIAYEDDDGIIRRLAQPSRQFAEHYRGRVFRDGDYFDVGTNPIRTISRLRCPVPGDVGALPVSGTTFDGAPAWAHRCRGCEAESHAHGSTRIRALRMRMRHDLDGVISEAALCSRSPSLAPGATASMAGGGAVNERYISIHELAALDGRLDAHDQALGRAVCHPRRGDAQPSLPAVRGDRVGARAGGSMDVDNRPAAGQRRRATYRRR